MSLNKTSGVAILLALTALGVAQEHTTDSGATPKASGIGDAIATISLQWWVVTLIAAAAIGSGVGYMAYRKEVSGGKAGSATGKGCLIGALVFFGIEIVAILVLASTMFNHPDESNDKHQATGSSVTNTATGSNGTAGTASTGSAAGTTGGTATTPASTAGTGSTANPATSTSGQTSTSGSTTGSTASTGDDY